MDSWDAEQLDVSKALFGTPVRLQLAEWILTRDEHEDAFIQSEAIKGVRSVSRSASSVPKALEVFVEAGMLDRSDLHGRAYYTPRPTPLWVAFLEGLRGIGRSVPEREVTGT